MTTSARKPAAATPPDLMLIVGQLLEATKAASDGLKSISVEVVGQAKTIIAAVKTIEMVEEKVAELDTIVRDSTNHSNLLTVSQGHTTQIAGIEAAITGLKKTLEDLKAEISKLGNSHASITSRKETLRNIGVIIAWIVTTAIAIYGAINGGK